LDNFGHFYQKILATLLLPNVVSLASKKNPVWPIRRRDNSFKSWQDSFFREFYQNLSPLSL
jgi:hypothetical protein